MAVCLRFNFDGCSLGNPGQIGIAECSEIRVHLLLSFF